jgi:hypothetical protein
MIQPEWSKLLDRLGVRLTWEQGECFCELTKSGYRINLDPRLPEDTRVVILRHELQHALAGDCLPGRALELGLTPQQLNVVADAVINASLPREKLVRASQSLKGPTARPITLDLFGWEKNYTPSRAELAPIIRQRQPNRQQKEDQQQPDQEQQQSDPRSDQTEELRHDPSCSVDELRRAHREFVERARGEIERMESASKPLPPADPRGLAARIRSLAAVLAQRAYRSGRGGMFTYVRNYKRPGRTPLTRGVCREPRVKVAVLVDVSGSLQKHWSELHGLAHRLACGGDLEVIVFAGSAAVVRGRDFPTIDSSDTRLGPALELARDAAAVAIISDFQLSDPQSLSNIHVPWIAVLVGDYSVKSVPAGTPKVIIEL